MGIMLKPLPPLATTRFDTAFAIEIIQPFVASSLNPCVIIVTPAARDICTVKKSEKTRIKTNLRCLCIHLILPMRQSESFYASPENCQELFVK